MCMEKYIEIQHITKIFPGQKALDDVSFSVNKGEIHALVGENGAGKSTLLNILHGVFPASSGTIKIGGQEVHFANASEAIHFGIAKVHQEISVIPEMTVAQNLMLGKEPCKYGMIDHKKMNQTAQELLDKLHCNFSAEDKIGDLTAGEKQMIAIAKALQLNASVISFDEPTASLSDAEVKILFEIIHELKKSGVTILYISHKMDEIFAHCDRATVLRDGKYITTLELKNCTEEDLIHAMVGRDVSLFAKRTKPSRCDKNQTVLKVSHFSGEAFQNVDFELHKGEILGFFGLVGAGRTEVMRAIYGADRATGGTVEYNGKILNCKKPTDAVKAGIALISENRKEEGVIPNLPNMDNIAISSLRKYQKGVFVSNSMKADNAKRVGEQVGLTPNDPEFMTSSLSGGNAQKVILARWMSTDADLMIFDEPTKGIDIGAKAEIYRLMEDMVENGKSIIMVSSELTEIMGMSDRILVMREGEIVKEIPREEFSEDNILKYAVGGSTK